MFIRPFYRTKDGKRHAYWGLVESVRTANGPRQQIVAYLGEGEESTRSGVLQAASGEGEVQGSLFESSAPEWVEVDASRLAVDRVTAFGGAWLGLWLMDQVGLRAWFESHLPRGRERVPWSSMATILVLCRLLDPSSELSIAEHFYASSALPELLGVPASKVNEDRLYRALDRLLPQKAALQAYLKERLGTLFDLDYDLLLYDVTSTYFEGLMAGVALAQRGYSRDHRPDCKQVCIGLVVSREGIPLGYEVFAGNRNDVTTLQQIVTTMETRYGKANRIWAVDRGMVSEANLAFLQAEDRRYIIGTPKSLLKQFKQALLADDWQTIESSLEVKLCPSPAGDEVFILCRSAARRDKERAMHDRFEARIEQGLLDLQAACIRSRQDPLVMAERLGRLMGKNTRASGLFRTAVLTAPDGSAWVDVSKDPQWRDWARLSEGCYILRSNITDWTGEALWQAYMQLTKAEAAFRIQKSDLRLRPVWHQKTERIEAHILVCFLAYVLWQTLGQFCRRAGLGDEPRRVLAELAEIRLIDVSVPTRTRAGPGPLLRRRLISRPTDHQAILLRHLDLPLPTRLTSANPEPM